MKQGKTSNILVMLPLTPWIQDYFVFSESVHASNIMEKMGKRILMTFLRYVGHNKLNNWLDCLTPN